MRTSPAGRNLKVAPEPAPPVGPVRHLTEADLTENERLRLFSCLNRGKRWFDRPTRSSSMLSKIHL